MSTDEPLTDADVYRAEAPQGDDIPPGESDGEGDTCDAYRKLAALRSLVLADLDATSDEQLRAEMVEDKLDPAVVAASVREGMRDAAAQAVREGGQRDMARWAGLAGAVSQPQQPPAPAAPAALADALQQCIGTLDGIASADWRKWEDYATAEGFAEWAKSRARWQADLARAALAAHAPAREPAHEESDRG